MMAMANFGRAFGAAVTGLVLSVALAAPAFAATVVTVNGTPITDVEINARTRLFAMEGNNSGTRGATDQLIDEAIQLSEAKRLGIEVSTSQIDEGVLSVARNVRMSRDNLLDVLRQNGVGIETLHARLRAAIAWNAVTETAVAPQVQVSDLELDQRAAGQVASFQSFDYILKEVIFLGQGGSARTGQANNYRSGFAGCDSAVERSLGYTDAAVIDVGRRHATQLPEPIAQELAGLNVGGITTPRTVENGVSMLAVCQKTQAEDLTFIKNDLEAEVGGDAFKTMAADYLTRLRAEAKIIYN